MLIHLSIYRNSTPLNFNDGLVSFNQIRQYFGMIETNWPWWHNSIVFVGKGKVHLLFYCIAHHQWRNQIWQTSLQFSSSSKRVEFHSVFRHDVHARAIFPPVVVRTCVPVKRFLDKIVKHGTKNTELPNFSIE